MAGEVPLCNRCFKVIGANKIKDLKFDYDSDGKTKCPQKNCDGRVFPIDDMMVLPITMLWQKGYDTAFCCSGHSWRGGIEGGDETYLVFVGHHTFDPPTGFTIEHSETPALTNHRLSGTARTTLRRRLVSGLDPMQRQRRLFRGLLSLTEWVYDLPDLTTEA